MSSGRIDAMSSSRGSRLRKLGVSLVSCLAWTGIPMPSGAAGMPELAGGGVSVWQRRVPDPYIRPAIYPSPTYVFVAYRVTNGTTADVKETSLDVVLSGRHEFLAAETSQGVCEAISESGETSIVCDLGALPARGNATVVLSSAATAAGHLASGATVWVGDEVRDSNEALFPVDGPVCDDRDEDGVG